ncbi:MAG: hypothetical protein WC608_02170 [Parcubacteria group bacterium]
MNETIAQIINSIKQANPLMYMASGMEDVVKILAEYKYDALEKTRYFKKLQNLEMKNKLAIVAVMFALNAHLKIKLNENTPGSLFLKGILTDVSPEIGKRIINGSNSLDPEEQEVIELIRDPGKGNNSYRPKNSSEQKTGPGFFDGTSDVLRRRLKGMIDKGGNKNA